MFCFGCLVVGLGIVVDGVHAVDCFGKWRMEGVWSEQLMLTLGFLPGLFKEDENDEEPKVEGTAVAVEAMFLYFGKVV